MKYHIQILRTFYHSGSWNISNLIYSIIKITYQLPDSSVEPDYVKTLWIPFKRFSWELFIAVKIIEINKVLIEIGLNEVCDSFSMVRQRVGHLIHILSTRTLTIGVLIPSLE